jgi:hypothetical protein
VPLVRCHVINCPNVHCARSAGHLEFGSLVKLPTPELCLSSSLGAGSIYR